MSMRIGWTPSLEPRRERATGDPWAHVAVPGAPPDAHDEAHGRATMDRMGERLHAEGVPSDRIEQITRQSARRADARVHGRDWHHIKER